MQLSVIMPVYNCREYLEDAVRSVFSGGASDIELIAVDDCSTDGSRELLLSLAEADRRIKPILFEKNSGVARVRNAALSAASGKYLAFCDSDDTVPEGAYAAMLGEIGDADVLVCAFADVSDGGVFRETHVEKGDRKSLFRSLFSVSCLWNKLFLSAPIKEAALSFDEDMKIGEDVVFLARLSNLDIRHRISDKLVYNHCHHESAKTPSLTHIYTLSAFREHLECRRRLLKISKAPECRDYVYTNFIEYLDRFLVFISDPEERAAAFAEYKEFLSGYDFESRGAAFRAMTGVDYKDFVSSGADAYIQLKYDALPRDRVLDEFRGGKIGLRWVFLYFKAWLAYKFSKK